MTSDSGIEIRRGLMNVYFDRTESCLVDGEIGKLLYRGYNIHDLAEKSTFEEVMYLLQNLTPDRFIQSQSWGKKV